MKTERGYQKHLSHGDTVLKDMQGRTQKSKKILSVLHDFCSNTRSLKCLDIGCSSGIITSSLADHFSLAIGIDIDQEAVRYARARTSSSRVTFLIADCMALPFRMEALDAIICNHVYEHVPSAEGMMNEIHRVLKRKGFCFLAAGNKHTLIEGHYGLPFLSWFPKSLGHLYLKLSGKGNFYYEEHLSLRGLRRLVRKFRIRDYTLPIIHNPEKYHAADLFSGGKFPPRWIRRLAPYVYRWIPTYIWVLVKE